LKNIITDIGEEVRNISHQMMPRALQELGLVAAVEDMLEKSLHPSPIKYKFEHFGLTKRLAEDVEIAIYRISQELINNIIKHSEAEMVGVQLIRRKDFLFLVVEDNGKGVAKGKAKGDGIGMLTIQNRLNIINGELEFNSAEGEGTSATIRVRL
jgi:signal transduction histidine kinase